MLFLSRSALGDGLVSLTIPHKFSGGKNSKQKEDSPTKTA